MQGIIYKVRIHLALETVLFAACLLSCNATVLFYLLAFYPVIDDRLFFLLQYCGGKKAIKLNKTTLNEYYGCSSGCLFARLKQVHFCLIVSAANRFLPAMLFTEFILLPESQFL